MSKIQLAALVGQVKAQAEITNRVTSDGYKLLDKPDKFTGLERTYQPTEDDGEQLPPESKQVEQTVDLILERALGVTRQHVELMATRDVANQSASAAIVVDGQVLTAKLPTTTLIALEKIFRDLHAQAKRIPTRNPQVNFVATKSAVIGGAITTVATSAPTARDKFTSIDEVVVVVPASDKHPAQTAVRKTQKRIGRWTEFQLSGAWDEAKKAALIDRIEKLMHAAKAAIAEANAREVEFVFDASKLFTFLHGA